MSIMTHVILRQPGHRDPLGQSPTPPPTNAPPPHLIFPGNLKDIGGDRQHLSGQLMMAEA